MSQDLFVRTMPASADNAPPVQSTVGLIPDAQLEDPESLKKAGRGAQSIAGEVNANASTMQSAFADSAPNLHGDDWDGQIGFALLHVAELWKNQNAKMVRTCLEISDNFIKTAENYDDTEETNTRAMKFSDDRDTPFG
ncbi:hypothetical protein MTQ01_21950 [Streptomyces sp. XM4193]|uniref:hypothetical protein n=1 Tax=Streptomyces sp. XM4193 TaxID=2929782 RepID=UPI001FFA85EF|nr:hypothetical protein [Streptomyces sp. XM4193]MCK1798639.1 hypothetical protein [Streptomyces sp. XM4193]